METASQLLVLNYHHIGDGDDTGFMVKPAELKAQLECLLNLGYIPLSLDEMLNLPLNPTDAKKYLMVTFDDGYEDFLTQALPVLESVQVPVLLFLIGDYIGGWNDWDPLRRSRQRHLALDELRELPRAHAVQFGGHSRTHPVLPWVNGRRLESEILGSKSILESALNTPVRSFAYPGGHFNRRVERLTARVYALGFAGLSRGVAKNFHPFRIRRFDPFLCRDLEEFQTELLTALIPLVPAAPSLWDRVRKLSAFFNQKGAGMPNWGIGSAYPPSGTDQNM